MGYYEILEVDRDADGNTIRRQFITLADKHHPRHNLGHLHESVDSFKRLCEAFDVLSNPLTRSIYDDRGVFGLNDDLHKGIIEHPLSGNGPFIEKFTFNENDKSHYTMGTAERLFEQASEKGLLDIEKDENLTSDPQFFSSFKQNMGDKNAQVTGNYYESSKIIGPDGKTVEVTKSSKLDPTGHIETHVKESFQDEHGKKIEKDWSNPQKLTTEEAPKGIQH